MAEKNYNHIPKEKFTFVNEGKLILGNMIVILFSHNITLPF